MAREENKQTRRSFLKQSAILVLMGGYAMGGDVDMSLSGKKSNKRKTLDVPSPMLPPVPAILLTVNGNGDISDEISVVWTFVINSEPAQIGVSVHDEYIALDLIKKHGQFVLNVPVAEMAQQFDVASMNLRKSIDKFSLTGLTRGSALKINAPTIEEAPIHVECEVFDTIKVPPVRTIFLANVVATSVKEYVCDEEGRLIVPSVPFFGMTAGSGEYYTMGQRVGQIGQSLGKQDIKY